MFRRLARPFYLQRVFKSKSSRPPSSSSSSPVSAFPSDIDQLSRLVKRKKTVVDRLLRDESKEESKEERFGIDLSGENSGFVVQFPGQGSQFVGMGQRLMEEPNLSPKVETMFRLANDVLGYDLLRLCLEGPKEELDKTIHCQPAIFVCSLAAAEHLATQVPKLRDNCLASIGFSVGEIAALTFAGAVRFEDALEIIKVRAEAMQMASELESSGMMSCFVRPMAELSLTCKLARQHCQNQFKIENPVCQIANYLYSDCKVSGAFHTPLMRPAIESFSEIVYEKEPMFRMPDIPVYSCVDAKPYHNERQIAQKMIKQLTSAVKWEQILHSIYALPTGIKHPITYECGPGNQLGILLRAVNKVAHESYVKQTI